MPNIFSLTRSLKLHISQDEISKKQLPVAVKTFTLSSNRKAFIRVLLYIIGLIQVALMYYWTTNSMLVSILNLLLFSLVYVASFPLISRLRIPGLVDHIWATWIIGGIGMLLGHQLDISYSGSGEHVHHHAGATAGFSAEFWTFLLSGMTITMLIFCIPACLYLCNRCLLHYDIVEKLGLHGGSSVFMLIGMLLAVQCEPLLFKVNNGFGYMSYYFMLFMMVVFSSSAYYFIARKISSKPLVSDNKNAH